MKMTSLKTCLILIGALAALASSGSAATVTYTGPANGAWTTAGNWSGGAVPTSSDDAILNATNQVYLNLSIGNQTIANLTGNAAGNGTIRVFGASSSTTNVFNVTGAINLTNNSSSTISVATFNSASNYYAIQTPSLTVRSLNVLSSSWLTAGPGSTWNVQSFELNGENSANRANFRVNGATVNVNELVGDGAYGLMLTRSAAETATLYVDSGTLSAKRIGIGRKSVGFENAGTGTLEWTGGTIRNFSGSDLLINSYDITDNYGLQINLSGAGTKTLTADSTRTIRVGANSTNISTGTNQNTSGAYFTGSTGTLLLDGAGTVEFYKTNSYNGTIQVNAGLLRLMSGTNTFAGVTADYASTIGGTSSTVGIGGGTVNLGGQSNTVGSLVLTAGTLTNGTLTAGTYDLRNGTVSAALAGSSGVTKSAAGTVTLSGANTYTGNTVISDGILVLSNALALQNSALDTATSVTGNANAGVRSTVTTLTLGGLTGNKNLADVFTTTSGGYGSVTALTLNPGTGVTNTYSGAIANGATNMTLTKIGAGTQVLSGANTYNGTTTITAGTLRLGANNTIPAGSSVTINGGTLDNSGNANTIRSLTITSGSLIGSGTMTVAPGGGVSLSGTGILAANLTTPGDVSVSTTDSSSTYYAIQSPSLTAKDLIVAPNSWLTAGPGSTWNLNGIDLNASGAAPRSNLRINGATVNVGSGGNSYNVMLSRGATETSTLFMDAGTLSAIRIGMGRKQANFQNTGTGTLEWTGGTIRNYAGQDLLFNSYDTVDTTYGLQINLTGAGNKTLTADSGRTIRVGANSVNDSTGTTQNTGGAYFTGSTGTLLLNGAGTVEFYKTNSYNGTIQVNAGTLKLISGSATYDGVTANYASTIGGTSSTVGIGGGTVNLGGQSNTVGSLVLTAGTLTNGTLTAATYALNGGTISANLGAGTINVSTGTTTLGSTGRFSDSSTLNIASGQLTLGGNESVASFTNAGTLGGSGTLTATTYALNGGTISANLGAGTINVGGNTTLSGTAAATTVNVNSGTLLTSGSANRLSSSATAAVSGGATLNLGGINQTLAGLTGTGSVTNSGGTLTLNVGSGNNTFEGSIAGAGGFTKTGNGTATLSGNNAYTGASTIGGGTLLVATSGSIASSILATVNDGGLLKVNGTAGAITVNSGGSLSGSGTNGLVTLNRGSLLNPGNSPGTLTAASAIILGGSTYNWEISALTATPGTTSWDLLSVTGLLNMSDVTSENRWNLVVTGDSGFAGWTGTSEYSYVFAQAASVSGFSTTVGTDVTSLFNITASGITSLPNKDFNPNGDFKVVVGSANGLTTLNLMAVPEPSTGSMLGLGLAGLVVTRLFRRKGV